MGEKQQVDFGSLHQGFFLYLQPVGRSHWLMVQERHCSVSGGRQSCGTSHLHSLQETLSVKFLYLYKSDQTFW